VRDVPIASISLSAVIVPVVGFAGVILGLWVNGTHNRRDRRSELHARALIAITSYGELPYRIRRRAPGAESRARLSEELSKVKAELEACQLLLDADGHADIARAFRNLETLARSTAGKAAHDAWRMAPIESDAQMNLGDVHHQLEPFNAARARFAEHLRIATLPWHHRVGRGKTVSVAVAQPTIPPQDLITSTVPSPAHHLATSSRTNAGA
jgi:hypothetical protein